MQATDSSTSSLTAAPPPRRPPPADPGPDGEPNTALSPASNPAEPADAEARPEARTETGDPGAAQRSAPAWGPPAETRPVSHASLSSADLAPSAVPPASAPTNDTNVYRPPPPARRVRSSSAQTLLGEAKDWKGLARRAATGAGLSMAYGLALGARDGGLDLLLHAVGVPAALLAVALLGLPALYIVLALFNAPLSLERAGSAAARGIASAGIVLAGLAPLAALYVVTSSSQSGAAIAGSLGLVVGGVLGLRHLASTLSEALREADSATRMVAGFAQLGFCLFAALLAWRVWGALLPLLGGA